VSLRVLALEFFFVGPESRWNLFDAVFVLNAMIELAVSHVRSANLNFSLIRILRTFRMIRIMRFAGLLRELRPMLLAIMSCAVPLFWSIVFLVFFFMFAVVFLRAVTVYLETAPSDDPNYEGMNTYFPSLPMAMLILFMTITGGVSWWEVVKLFLDVSIFYVVLFALVVVIMLLAVMNVLTAMFVSDAVERASRDRAIVLDAEKDRTAKNMKVLQGRVW